jgi:hypothetical protein
MPIMKIIAVIFFCLIFSSCTKKPTNTQITGTYFGDLGYSNPPIVSGGASVIISAGRGSNNIIVTDTFNFGKLNATISGNSITIPNQTTTVGQSAVIDTFYGSGFVKGGSLFLTLYENGNGTALNSPIINFNGVKH